MTTSTPLLWFLTRASLWIAGTVVLAVVLFIGFYTAKLDFLLYPLIPTEWIMKGIQVLGLTSIEETTDFEMSLILGLCFVLAAVIMTVIDRQWLRHRIR
jgi:hypothetical protein